MTGAGHQTRMRNHRFKPFLRPLKMKISTLTNLLYKMYVKQKTGRKHVHTRCTKNSRKYTFKKTYILCFYLIYIPIHAFFLYTAVSSCIHAFFLYLYFYILNTRIFSLCWSPIIPRRYFVSKKKKKTSFFRLNRPFSMLN